MIKVWTEEERNALEKIYDSKSGHYEGLFAVYNAGGKALPLPAGMTKEDVKAMFDLLMESDDSSFMAAFMNRHRDDILNLLAIYTAFGKE